MDEQKFERVKELVDELKKIVDEMDKQPKTEVSKKFRERLNDLERKNRLSIEKII